MKVISETEMCPRDDLAAYVDGELSAEANTALELHVKGCAVCSRSLREQRQFLAALSASLDESNAIDLPADFTKKIVTKAESSVSGVRRPNELFTAICISSALLLFVLFAFGGETFAIASAAGSVGEQLLTVGSFVLKVAGNFVFGVAVVSRSLASYFDPSLLVAALLVFVGALLFLSSKRILRRRDA